LPALRWGTPCAVGRGLDSLTADLRGGLPEPIGRRETRFSERLMREVTWHVYLCRGGSAVTDAHGVRDRCVYPERAPTIPPLPARASEITSALHCGLAPRSSAPTFRQGLARAAGGLCGRLPKTPVSTARSGRLRVVRRGLRPRQGALPPPIRPRVKVVGDQRQREPALFRQPCGRGGYPPETRNARGTPGPRHARLVVGLRSRGEESAS
jgi:hypothetical protein